MRSTGCSPRSIFAVARPRLRAGRPGQSRPAIDSPRCAGCAASATRRRCLLGNHDLHLLAVAARRAQACTAATRLTRDPRGPRPRRLDRMAARHRMARYEHGWLMVHAGVVPQWDVAQTLALAREVEQLLRGSRPARLPARDVRQRARCAGTRRSPARAPALHHQRADAHPLRRCRRHARIQHQGRRRRSAAGLLPWFDVPGRRTQGTPIAFGHWSHARPGTSGRDLLALDTGCVWGGLLTAARIDGGRRESSRCRASRCRLPADD